jgi:hypothetical protein
MYYAFLLIVLLLVSIYLIKKVIDRLSSRRRQSGSKLPEHFYRYVLIITFMLAGAGVVRALIIGAEMLDTVQSPDVSVSQWTMFILPFYIIEGLTYIVPGIIYLIAATILRRNYRASGGLITVGAALLTAACTGQGLFMLYILFEASS